MMAIQINCILHRKTKKQQIKKKSQNKLQIQEAFENISVFPQINSLYFTQKYFQNAYKKMKSTSAHAIKKKNH